MTKRAIAALTVLLLAFSYVCAPLTAEAQTTTDTQITGTVSDANTGLPLSGATITAVGPTNKSATTNNTGNFSIGGLTPGFYSLQVRLPGYQPSQSENITVSSAQQARVGLSLQRSQSSTSGNYQTIGRTSSRRSEQLQTASVIYRSTDVQTEVTNQGFYRIGDALRQLPGVNESGSETAAPSDDLALDIRGIGDLETQTTIDGHPVGYGLGTPYNFEISPTAPFRGVQTIYGSGGNELFPINAIGGIINLQTLEPTTKPQTNLIQQYGTWSQEASTVQSTGSFGKFGYAIGAGVQGIDGPARHNRLFNATSSLDQSSPGYYHDTGLYDVDTSANMRSLLGKLRYNLNATQNITFSALSMNFYDDKTGNGDNDYLPYEVALLQANNNVGGSYKVTDANGQPVCFDPNTGATDTACPSNESQLKAACPAALVPSVNANGVPNGTLTNKGPNTSPGVPGAVSSTTAGGAPVAYGGTLGAPCLTPQQYAANNSGWQGAGPAFQRYHVGSFGTRFTSNPNKYSSFTADVFTTDYTHHYDRSQQFPLVVAADGSLAPNFYTYDEGVVNSGFVLTDTLLSQYNSFGIGAFYDNIDYEHKGNGAENSTAFANERAVFLRDQYQIPNTPLTAFGNLWYKQSTVTNTQYLDPRLSLVYAQGNDVIRASVGGTTTQPQLAVLNSPFVATAPGSFLGNAGSCSATSPCSIGSIGAAPNLRPERGVDEEFAIGHRFNNNSILQATFYNTNVYNKLFSLTAPLTVTGLGSLPPGTVAQYAGYVPQCSNPVTCLGLSTVTNIAQIRAQGIEINGTQRLFRGLVADYDYGTESNRVISADPSLLATNGNIILGAQRANVPLHKYNVGLAYNFNRDTTLRIAYHHVSDNNPKNLPAYGYADLRLEAKAGPGRFAIGVNNLFNALADYRGQIGQGVPLAGNSFQGPDSIVSPNCTSGCPISTERFNLPFRTIDFTYSIGIR